MTLVINIFVFLFGLMVGSFLNAVIYRLHKKTSPLRGRSKCPKCGKVLNWYELLPVVSFFVQKRRCRGCKKRISFQYPLVEVITAFVFLLVFTSYELLVTGYLWIIASGLIIIFVYDLKHYIIPDKILFPLIGIVAVAELFGIWGLGSILNSVISAIVVSLFFFAIYFFSKGRGMGFGDVKLAFFIGLFLGPANSTVAVFIAFLLGAIIGIALIIKGKKSLKSKIPFGPFLIIGMFVALFWGQEILNWYLKLFL